MSIAGKSRSRLSGLARLWIVATAVSWIAGGADVALSPSPFQWSLPLSDATPQSIRHVLWFLGPLFVAAVWIAVRWVWHGFRPPPEEAAASRMGTAEIAQRAFGLLAKVGFALALLAVGVAGLWLGNYMMDSANTIWKWLLAMFHFGFMAYILITAWEVISEPFDDKGGTGRSQL